MLFAEKSHSRVVIAARLMNKLFDRRKLQASAVGQCIRRCHAGTGLLLLLIVLCCAANGNATTFTVTSTADTGAPGTLRWAINQANAAGAGTHTIAFSLPSSSTIALTSPLPTLNNGAATITVNGSGASGLTVSGVSPNQIFTVQNGPVTITSLTVAGTGNMAKTGSGTLTLSGTSTYTGGTTVSAGVLQGNTTSLQGNIADDANVTFNQTTTGTYAGVVSGTGSVTKSGTGTTIFSGANTYSGGTTVTAGILQGDTTSLQGNIANSARVTFSQTTTGTYAGIISGTGNLLKLGTGTTILSGANTYTGGTTVSAGVLQGDTTSVRGNIVNNANVTYDQATTGTYSGVMSGTGSLTKAGAGTLTLSGANTYTGGTTVSGGILQGNTTSVRGNIVNNANVTYDQAMAGTYSGIMSGTGSLTKTGAGTLTLSGANTYTGGTTVSAGVLQGNTTNLQGNIADDANVTFNQTATGTYTGVVSGTGSVTKIGNGTLTLSGANTYSGGTTVSAGVLQGDTTSLQGNITDNANVTFSQSTTGTYAGVVSGTGSLTKSGTGTTILSGANTYTGGTTVSGGVLQGNTTSLQGNIANTANVNFAQGTAGTYAGIVSGTGSLLKTGAGTLTLSGANTYTGGTTVSAGVLQGNTTSVRGNIVNNANVTYDQAAAGTYSGIMSGTGSLAKTGAGTLTLSGANTYTGGTTVSAGVLQGTTTSLQGNIADDANVTFNQTSTGTYTGVVSGTGSVTKIGSGTVTLSGANTYTGGTTVSAGVLQGNTTSLQGNITDNANVTFSQSTTGTYAGVVSGTGSVTKSGTGTTILSGANTYTGGTTVSAGVLQGDTTSVRGNIVNNANVTYDQATAGTYSGVMSGTGSLIKTGAGTLTLSGANTYTGGTTVSAGILQGNTASVRGNIVNNANVTYDQATAGTYSGIMSGTGTLAKTGAGTLTLSGANTYTGGTTVSAGVLQGSSTNLQGNIANSANVTFNQSSTGTYAGEVSGAGSVTKIGNGTLTLSGANTYTGGTTVSAGVLQGSSTNLQGNIANSARVTFSQTTTGTYEGVISGTGNLLKLGTGTTILSGANTYTGGTTVSAGVLQGDTTSVRGNIVNNANVTYDQANAGTYAGVMSGTGGLTKTGAGKLTLSGSNTYTGSTTVDNGQLTLNGSINSNTTVGPQGILGGVGTIQRDLDNQGVVAPGSSIGTLNVSGNYAQATGSSLHVEIDNNGNAPGVNNDLLSVNGSSAVAGGTVNVAAAPGNYQAGTTYTFLNSNGGVSGAFTGATDDIDFLHAELGYTSNSAFFTLVFDQTDFAAIADTRNELAVAQYLDAISTSVTGDLQTVFTALSTASDPEARMAFNQISGELYGTLGQIGLQNTTLVLAQLSQRIRAGSFNEQQTAPVAAPARSQSSTPITFASYSPSRQRPSTIFAAEQPTSDWTSWAFGLGLGGAAKSDGNATGLNYGLGGTLIGIEKAWPDNERIGLFGGYLGTQLSTTNPTQSGSIQGGQFGGYNFHDDGFNYYSLIGGLQFNGYSTRRAIDFNGIDRVADGAFSGWQSYGYLERGVKFQSSQFVLQPYAALQYIYLRQNSFTESGADSLNLSVAGLDANSLRSLLGGRMQFNRSWSRRGSLLPEFRAVWLHEFLQTSSVVNSFFAPIGGQSFAVQGLNLGRDWALVGGGLRWDLDSRWSFYGNYDAQVNGQQAFHVGSGGLQFVR